MEMLFSATSPVIPFGASPYWNRCSELKNISVASSQVTFACRSTTSGGRTHSAIAPVSSLTSRRSGHRLTRRWGGKELTQLIASRLVCCRRCNGVLDKVWIELVLLLLFFFAKLHCTSCKPVRGSIAWGETCGAVTASACWSLCVPQSVRGLRVWLVVESRVEPVEQCRVLACRSESTREDTAVFLEDDVIFRRTVSIFATFLAQSHSFVTNSNCQLRFVA